MTGGARGRPAMPRPEARPPSVVAKSSKSHGPVGAPLLEAPPTTQGGGGVRHTRLRRGSRKNASSFHGP